MPERDALNVFEGLGMEPHPQLSEPNPSVTLEKFIDHLKRNGVKAKRNESGSQWLFTRKQKDGGWFSRKVKFNSEYTPATNPEQPENWRRLADVCRELNVGSPYAVDEWETKNLVETTKIGDHVRTYALDLVVRRDPASGKTYFSSSAQAVETVVSADSISPVEASRVVDAFGAPQPAFIPPNDWQARAPQTYLQRANLTLGSQVAAAANNAPVPPDNAEDSEDYENATVIDAREFQALIWANNSDRGSSDDGGRETLTQEDLLKDPEKYTHGEPDFPEDPLKDPDGGEHGPGH